MHRAVRRLLLSLLLLALLAALAPADAAKKPKLRPCSDGRFLVTAGVSLVPDGAAVPDAITVTARRIALDGGCDPVRATVQPAARGTRLAARWQRCGTARAVRLKAMIAASDCATVTGTVSAKGRRPTRFTATRSQCGDGRVDALAEGCDGDGTCPANEVCTDCACGPASVTTTTTTPPPLATTTTTTSPPLATTTTTLPVSGSDPTAASLSAAAAALAAGVDEVALSPDGVGWRYRRTRENGTVIAEELLRDGAVVLRWSHAGDESQGEADRDADGSLERRWHVVRGSAGVGTLVLTDDPDEDGTPRRRVTYTLDGAVLHVVVERDDGSGTLVEADSYDTSPVQAASFGGLPQAAADCSDAQRQQIESLFQQAWAKGSQCFRDLGLDTTLNFLTWKLATDGIAFTCGELPQDYCAQVDISDSLLRGALPTPVGVTIDPRYFFGNATCLANQQNVLWHEVLHVAHGPHSPGFTVTNDETYACSALCFDQTPPRATKCQCATCLDTDPCDPRCARYADCGQDCSLGARIDQAACISTPCPCGAGPGRIEIQRAVGEVRGPVGTYLQVNAPKIMGGVISCGSWSPSSCPSNGTNQLVCCKRESEGQPATSSFEASFPTLPPFMGIPQCNCGSPSPGYNFVAQAIGTTTGVEDLRTATPCS